ncbi:hypothetical protein [Prevotella sp. 10(H)]|uniref:hypothetical protein n=1 Tax=Prevotella sp. 10(H) TaxID=1158294 RepID=UPI000AEEAEB4|nr:hypothetical protein [Prevotella sp. 10(H)]
MKITDGQLNETDNQQKVELVSDDKQRITSPEEDYQKLKETKRRRKKYWYWVKNK